MDFDFLELFISQSGGLFKNAVLYRNFPDIVNAPLPPLLESFWAILLPSCQNVRKGLESSPTMPKWRNWQTR